MVKCIFFFGVLLGCCFLNAQEFNQKLFTNNEWSTLASDSLFYTKDTLRLLEIHKDKEIDNQRYVEDLSTYYNNNDFIKLSFQKNRNLDLSTTIVDKWLVQKTKGKYTWRFIKKDNVLELFLNAALIGKFKVLGSKNVTVRSIYAGKDKIITSELVLVRMYK